MNKKKFNINNYFNIKLFWEAFKQTRVIGIATLIILSALAVFLPYTNYLSIKDEMQYFSYSVLLFDTSELMIPIIALAIIVAPIMYITLFNFLTKRSGSDFYHSLPVKRSCLFTSFTTAIISWLFISCFTYVLLTIASAKLLCNCYVLDYSTIIAFTTNIFITSLAVIGAFAIGSSLTGTKISSIFMSCGILFLPRIVINILTSLVLTNSTSLTPNSGLIIFKDTINLPYALISVIWNSESSYQSAFLCMGLPSLYSIVLAIVYIVIGVKLFTSRPSECSSKSFRSSKIFAVLRIGSGFAISLAIVANIYSFVVYDSATKWITTNIAKLILLIIAMTMLMFGLETAYTKSIKKGLKATIYTPIILIFDVILIFGMYNFTKTYNNETIDANDVNYIYAGDFFANCVYQTDEYSEDYISYCNSQLAKTKITDSEIIDYLLDIYNSNRTYDFKIPTSYEYQPYEITFNTFFGDKTRWVYLNSEETQYLSQKLQNIEEVKKCFYQFPDVENSSILCNELNAKQSKEIYKSLISELATLSYEDICNIYCTESNISNYGYMGTIEVQTFIDGKIQYIYMPVASLTPKTFLMTMSYKNETSKKSALDFINTNKTNVSEADMHIGFSAYNVLLDGSSDIDYAFSSYDTEHPKYEEKMELLLSLLSDAVKNNNNLSNVDLYDKNTVICYVYFSHQNSYGSYTLILPANSPLFDGLENFYKEDDSLTETIIYD